MSALFRSLAMGVLIVIAVSCQRQSEEPAPSNPPVTGSQTLTVVPEQALSDPSNPCSTGPVKNPAEPILCIDDSAFPVITVDPPPDVDVTLETTKSVYWFTKSETGTIAILYDSDLLDPPASKLKKGMTKAKAGNLPGSVKYSILVQRGNVISNVIDPTIIIDTNR